MRHRRWLILPLCLLLWGCAGSRDQVPEPPSGMLSTLPSLDAALRSASFADASQVRYGSEYDPALSTARVVGIPEFPGVLFMNPVAGPPLQPAWAVYSFDLAGYDEEPLVKLTWTQKPLGGTAWLMLANWAEQRWEFIAADPTAVNLDTLDPYLDGTGKLLLAVIVGGSVQRQLRWLAVGDAPAPAPPRAYEVFPKSSRPDEPLTLSAQVTGTQPLGYEWDFGGGATPNESTDAKPTVTMGPLGDYDCSLKLTNKYGEFTFNFQIHSVNPTVTARLIGDASKNKFVAIETTSTDDSLVAAEMDGQRVSVFEFDKDGNLLWNRAYTGLPANRVREIMLASTVQPDLAETYLACYQQDGAEVGNAYVVRLAVGGDVDWYQPLGPGLPDISLNDQNKVAVSVARPDGTSIVAMLDGSGNIEWAKRTVQPANFYCSAGGVQSLSEGVYLAGDVGGTMTIMRVSPTGTPAWAMTYPGNGKIADCELMPGTGLMVAGTLPFLPEQKWDMFFMNVRVDGLTLSHVKYRTHPNFPTKISHVKGYAFLTCNASFPSETSVWVLDGLGGFYRALRVEGFGGLLAGDSQFSRYVHTEEHTPAPPEVFMLAGSGTTKDLTISQFTASPIMLDPPVTTNITIDLEDFILPSEDLTITPEELTYTIDVPAGDLDGIFLSGINLF